MSYSGAGTACHRDRGASLSTAPEWERTSRNAFLAEISGGVKIGKARQGLLLRGHEVAGRGQQGLDHCHAVARMPSRVLADTSTVVMDVEVE